MDATAHLKMLQAAMRSSGLDALLLGGEAAGQFAAGHTRIGVHMPGWPVPVAAIPADGPPHIVTADPDGALSLPADRVHGMMWNPATLISELPGWLGGGSGLRIGIDSLSPGGRELISAAIPGVILIDASETLAEVMLVKTDEERAAMAALCGQVTDAAEAGLRHGRTALYRALGGAFPITYPLLGGGRVAVAVRRDGLIAEARIGPGDPSVGERAVACLAPGRPVAALATELPAGVEVVGLGWSYEPPLIRSGRAFPPGLELRPGAVLGVLWDQCGVTVALGPDRPVFYSGTPAEVAR